MRCDRTVPLHCPAWIIPAVALLSLPAIVRVLEIPTPTWLAYDKAFYGDTVQLPKDALLVHQERAYASPIWYTP